MSDVRRSGVSRCPTEKQYQQLRVLGSGAASLSRTRRDTEPLLRRGWVTAEWRPPYYQWVVITPAGLRALAQAVERYGWPEFTNPTVHQKVCADCNAPFEAACRRCGCRSYQYENKTPEEVMA